MTTTQILAKLDKVIELLEQVVGSELSNNHLQVHEPLPYGRVSGEPLQLVQQTPFSINLDEYTKNDMKRKRTRILNKSKFLDSTQRESLFGFIDQFKQSDAIDKLRKQTKHKRPSIFQKIVKEKLDIKLSYYMSNKLVNLMLNEQTDEQQTDVKFDDKFDDKFDNIEFDKYDDKYDDNSDDNEYDFADELLSD